MYTSTPLSLLPFSLQHFLLLPSFLQASPPIFAPLFPLIILQMFHPLSFYHPHLSLSPHASVTFISIFCLFPPFSILLVCFSFFLSSLPFGPYHSPPTLLLLSPSSLEILQLCPLTVFHPLLPPFLLSSNLCTLFSHFSPSLFFNIFFSYPLSFKLLPPFSLPFSLLSSSRCSILFPSIILTSLFPPCFRHFYLHPPPLLLFLSLLPPLWSLSFSPFSTSTFPFFPGNSSALSAYCLSPSFAPFSTLFQPLYSFFPLLSLSSQSILISPVLSPSFSRHPLPFSPLPSFSFPPLSFDTSQTRKIDLFHFSLSRPQLSPLIHCLHLPSTKNSSPPYQPSPLFLLLISLTQTLKIPSNNKLFPKLSTKFRFPPKNATHANPLRTQNRFKCPKYPLPAPTTDT